MLSLGLVWIKQNLPELSGRFCLDERFRLFLAEDPVHPRTALLADAFHGAPLSALAGHSDLFGVFHSALFAALDAVAHNRARLCGRWARWCRFIHIRSIAYTSLKMKGVGLKSSPAQRSLIYKGHPTPDRYVL